MNAEHSSHTAGQRATDADVLLRVENVVKYFPVQSGKLFRAGQGRRACR